MKQEAVSNGLAAQILRFVLVGGFVTALGVVVYWVPATFMGVPPILANFLAYVVAAGLGYVLHSRVSFRGHGSRDNPGQRTFRFLMVSLVSLGLNTFWVWSLVTHLHGPTWWAIPPMVFVTPAVTFALNRVWVFA
jgi:putative flippase GtrA